MTHACHLSTEGLKQRDPEDSLGYLDLNSDKQSNTEEMILETKRRRVVPRAGWGGKLGVNSWNKENFLKSGFPVAVTPLCNSNS